MARGPRGHDFRLLDALGDIAGAAYEGTVWRVVRNGRSVMDGSLGSGRWNSRDLSVLYASQEPDGAIAEIHYLISRAQSVFPSRMEHMLYEVRIKARQLLILSTMDQLTDLGVETSRYSEILYGRTQEIADAAAFMGFEGLIAPSARWSCQNLILFLDVFDLDNIEVRSNVPVDWDEWIKTNRR